MGKSYKLSRSENIYEFTAQDIFIRTYHNIPLLSVYHLHSPQMQGSDSDVSIASDYRASKGNLKGRLSGMFGKRSSSGTRESNDRIAAAADAASSTARPVSVTTLNVSNGQMTSDGIDAGLPPPTTPRVRRAVSASLEFMWIVVLNVFLSFVYMSRALGADVTAANADREHAVHAAQSRASDVVVSVEQTAVIDERSASLAALFSSTPHLHYFYRQSRSFCQKFLYPVLMN